VTRVQQRYYDAIRSFIEKNHHSPTYAQIGQIVGVSSSATVSRAVHSLIKQGYLSFGGAEVGKANGIQLVSGKIASFMRTLDSCNRNHPAIWYMTAECPLCDVLSRISTGKSEAVAL
jgi:SOS-response transcriptional repressor LexA